MTRPALRAPSSRASEARLDELRRAGRDGRVDGCGATVQGGPLPARLLPAPTSAGYYGLPALKPPVWTWEVPLYFFVGGLAGMSAVVAFAALTAGVSGLAATAAGVAAVGGGLVAPILLAMDLGRPRRFLNMLRVCKWRSPMSVGAWLLTAFGACAVSGFVAVEVLRSTPGTLATVAAWSFLLPAALLGAVLATYTGVLIGATAVPAWVTHCRLLPVHFGVAGLGSAAAILELAGHRVPALNAIGLLAAGAETVTFVLMEARRHGAADRALRQGAASWLLRGAGLLSGPIALGLRIVGLHTLAAVGFSLGALGSRFGWLAAGRRSARDPAAAFAVARDRRGAAGTAVERPRPVPQQEDDR